MPRILSLIFGLFLSAITFGQSPYSILPEPKSMTLKSGVFEWNENTTLVYDSFCEEEAKWFAEWMQSATGKPVKMLHADNNPPTSNFVLIAAAGNYSATHDDSKFESLPPNIREQAKNINQETYEITIDTRGILITGATDAGSFYALQTLRQMLPVSAETNQLKLPYVLMNVSINDEAAFPHRGLLLDCGRHFMDKQKVKQYIDLLALYKMNVLHWHLTEDQGWRIEIKKYPLLTSVGAYRKEADGSTYGGFYTQEDIKEVVAYATSRHVTIIPEIEMPGHSVAAIAAYPKLSCRGEKIEVENEWGVFKDIYCAGNDETFTFLQNVLDEVCALFPGPYIHIGGDEAPKYRWENCDKCQKRIKTEKLKDEAALQTYFIERIANYLATKNKQIIGWDEIEEGGIPANATVQSWRGMEGGTTAALAKHQAIMSPTSHCYFDYPLSNIDLEKVYNFQPIPEKLTQANQRYIIGGECNMWSEHAPQNLVDSKVFPRLLAMSEVLWTAPKKRDFAAFNKRVENQYKRLDALKVDYGFPAIPVTISTQSATGTITLTLEKKMPDVQLSYAMRTSTSAPQDVYTPFTAPVEIKDRTNVLVKATYLGKSYTDSLSRMLDPHTGVGAEIKLGYEPSKYYTGGGLHALNDGNIGSLNFRDGMWQAVQGQDMEVVLDLGVEKSLSTLSTNWYHYGNAWIFRPVSVEYFYSNDGTKWTSLEVVNSKKPLEESGESIETLMSRFTPIKARYIKMIAKNPGPCPAWHDAAGEPSWMFCDEVVVH